MQTGNKRTISDFLNTEFRQYALYTVHGRALPTLLDGFKPVHKKIMWTARRKAANKPVKTVSLSGYVIADADYKHGDASAIDSIVNMAAPWRNNLNLLEGLGNFGWRMVPEAGAPRYTKVQLHDNFNRWFSDFNALDFVPGDDGAFYEPVCYYANVPWFFVNGFRGIATGYSCFCHPRDPQKLAQLMLDLLDGKVPCTSSLDISYPEYDGIIADGMSMGAVKKISQKKMAICSLPVEYTIESYAKYLSNLIDKGIIRDFHKTVAEGQPPFVVDLKGPLANPIKSLGLSRKLTGETLTFIHDGHLVEFDTPWDAVGLFVQERLKIAGKGLQAAKTSNQDLQSRIQTKIRFVELLTERGLEGLTRQDLRKIIVGLDRPDMADTLLSMAASKMTEDSIGKWTDQIMNLSEDLSVLNSVNPSIWLKYNILNQPSS